MADEYEIIRLGAQGDGVAATPQGIRYITGGLPGERVRLPDGPSPEVLVRSPEGIAPVCPYFGTCGGCVAQHMSDQLYADWKRDVVVEALRQHRLETEVAPLRRVVPGSRRRTVLTAQREGSARLALGYHRRKSRELVDIEECPILVPAIADALPGLRAVAELIAGPELRMTVLETQGGLDVSIESAARRLNPSFVSALAHAAKENRLARVTINGETIIEQTAPALSFGAVRVVPPPGAFVQASQAAEEAMKGLVLGALGRAKRVADLFCGVGTWTFPISQRARVLAVDGDKAALDALAAAARRAHGLKPIETRLRDLFREPLGPQELKGLDAVIFDPPRAGARAQSERLAKSQVPVVVAVSCDPGTLARDLRILVDGGYRLETVTPIDQFEYSAHVEAVAVLRRPR